MVTGGCTREKAERKEQKIKKIKKLITHGVEMQIPHRLAAKESLQNRIWQTGQRTRNDLEAAVRVISCGGHLRQAI